MLSLADFSAGDYLIAAITASELLHGIYRAKTEAQRLARTADVENILSNVTLIPFDLVVARVHAQLDASLRATGNKVGANDLAIAAHGRRRWCAASAIEYRGSRGDPSRGRCR